MPPVAPSVVVVAAGSDARMRSSLARPLHPLCGRPMIRLVIDAVGALEPRRLAAVVSPGSDDVVKELGPTSAEVSYVAANVRHDPCAAVLAALAGWVDDDLDLDPDDDDVLVIPANVALVRGETLRALHRAHRSSDASATVLVGVPTEEDSGTVWFVRRSLLAPALRRAKFPDIAAIGAVLRDTGHEIHMFVAPDQEETMNIRDRVDLAEAESRLRTRINAAWLLKGVTMLDPDHTYVDASVTLHADVTLYPGVVLEGATVIGEGTRIGPGCRLVDARVGAHCRIDQTSGELTTVGAHSRVGPFAVLEPGSDIPGATVTGPFYTAGPDAP